jgi:hypothetical protein
VAAGLSVNTPIVSGSETTETVTTVTVITAIAIATVTVTAMITTGDMATAVEDMGPMIRVEWQPPQLWPHRLTPSMAPLKRQKVPS